MNYHEKIKKFRELRNYTQEYMAENLNVTQRAYSSIENGKTQLTVDRLFEIAKILNVTVIEILDLEITTSYNNNFNNGATHNKGGDFIFKKDDFEEQRKLYERIIQTKEEEINFLRGKLS
jgi:hypothetical protein